MIVFIEPALKPFQETGDTKFAFEWSCEQMYVIRHYNDAKCLPSAQTTQNLLDHVPRSVVRQEVLANGNANGEKVNHVMFPWQHDGNSRRSSHNAQIEDQGKWWPLQERRFTETPYNL